MKMKETLNLSKARITGLVKGIHYVYGQFKKKTEVRN